MCSHVISPSFCMEEPEAPGQHQAAQPPPPQQGRAPALPQAVPAEQAVPTSHPTLQ